MRTIGLTGGIASGKSIVAGMLKKLGAWIIDADQLARAVVEPGQPAWQEIRDWLGPEMFFTDHYLNRKALGKRIFQDAAVRHRLEEIIHPYIQKAVQSSLQEAENAGTAVAVLDIPLLFEVGWDELVDETWVVFVHDETQLARLMAREHLARSEALARIGVQMSLAEKARLATRIIDNDGDVGSTKKQVESAWLQVIAAGGTKA